MADVLISQLPPFTDFDPNDIVPVTDISTNITRKYTLGNILSGLSSSLSSLANGTQAVTQPTADATTLLATDAFVHNVVQTTYASPTIGGGIKIRLDGTVAYITTDGSNP